MLDNDRLWPRMRFKSMYSRLLGEISRCSSGLSLWGELVRVFSPQLTRSYFCIILFDLQSRQIVPMVVHVIAMNAMESVQGLKLTVQSQLEKVKRLKISLWWASKSRLGPVMSGRSWSLIKDYGMNFDFSFDFKPNSIPDGYGHVLQVGQTEVSSYEDSMAFLFYNKNDYFQGRINSW